MPNEKDFPNLELKTEGITIDAHVSYHVLVKKLDTQETHPYLFIRRPVTRKERIKVPQPPLGVQNWWPGVILRSSLMSHWATLVTYSM